MNSKCDEWDTLTSPPSPQPKLHEISFVTFDVNLNKHKHPIATLYIHVFKFPKMSKVNECTYASYIAHTYYNCINHRCSPSKSVH